MISVTVTRFTTAAPSGVVFLWSSKGLFLAELGSLNCTLSQLFPVSLGRIADSVAQVQRDYRLTWGGCLSDNVDSAGRINLILVLDRRHFPNHHPARNRLYCRPASDNRKGIGP